MFYKGRPIFPEVNKYKNGNIHITLHECELVPDGDGFPDPSPLAVLSVNVDDKVPDNCIWVRDDDDSSNGDIVRALIDQSFLSYTGDIRASGYIYLKLVRLSKNFFDKVDYRQTIKQ